AGTPRGHAHDDPVDHQRAAAVAGADAVVAVVVPGAHHEVRVHLHVEDLAAAGVVDRQGRLLEHTRRGAAAGALAVADGQALLAGRGEPPVPRWGELRPLLRRHGQVVGDRDHRDVVPGLPPARTGVLRVHLVLGHLGAERLAADHVQVVAAVPVTLVAAHV